MAREVLKKLFELVFNVKIKKIRATPPALYQLNSGIKIVTLLQHSALDMYLLAVKTFLFHLGSGEVHVLDDGSLTAEDHAVLKQHIPHIIIENVKNIDTGNCPKGNCWERLVYILNLAKTAYVIQLDSDTLSLTPMPEVYDAIVNNRCFTIGSPIWPLPVNVNYLKDIWKNSPSTHIQVVAERAFHELAFFAQNPDYIRGSAAFAGFAPQQVSLDMLTDFSCQIEAVIGRSAWFSWGSEQVASNVMVAQSANPLVLPWPRYQNYKYPEPYQGAFASTSLIHFIGTYRFYDRRYEKLAMQFIQANSI